MAAWSITRIGEPPIFGKRFGRVRALTAACVAAPADAGAARSQLGGRHCATRAKARRHRGKQGIDARESAAVAAGAAA